MIASKPIVLYGHSYTPNPSKVVMILEELKIPYEHIIIDLAVVKEEPYLSINPNGRLPAIKDPNTGITLWESGAIVEYLVETYDDTGALSLASREDRFLLKQWLHFQVSGQGPYFGQLGWFKLFHPEDVPSAKERYEEQTVRVLSVLDRALKGKKYLVGDKAKLIGEGWNAKWEVDSKYPDYAAWGERIRARPVVKNVLETMGKQRAAEEEQAKAQK
ncbi:hypothetical protein COL516b_002561 [Colletotrichum fioriniae]|nr:uncharacterized protein COL516b_002561 [Colletotrichum fioriniae]KAJ0310055.1 hypothetical protein COL516b_002561 [Colletotrichum fioriniae]